MKVKTKICERCKGEGWLRAHVGANRADDEECPDCAGAGVVDA